MSKLYELNGIITPSCPGWEFIPSESHDGMTFNPAEGNYPDKGGKLMGPLIDGVEEFQFYTLSFEAECPEDCHWAAFFHDVDGNMITADVYSSIYTGQKAYKVVVYSRHKSVGIQPLFQSLKGVKVSNLVIEKISAETAVEWCDEQYADLPQLNYNDPQAAMRLLPKTAEALGHGSPWRVVMLGDSIINDTFNGNFQALVKRSNPESNIDWICSVRGGTGCWFYQEPENFQEYVVDLEPDLLVIGGISQKLNLDAVEKVIAMAQDQLNCEIMLLSGPFGNKDSQRELADFAIDLKQLADKMNIEFMDCCKVWVDYMAETEILQDFFYRDPVHANDRGKQIIGRAINKYITG